MKYLNLGCGSHYSPAEEWTNVDFRAHSDRVIAHNLLQGIPFPDGSFDVVYHSHVLEHFNKRYALTFIRECHRVLKQNGVIRVAVPDLEQIATLYLKCLAAASSSPEDPRARADYDWMILEMYDQVVRGESGGDMARYLAQPHLINEEFVMFRLGAEAQAIRSGASHGVRETASSRSFTRRLMGVMRRVVTPRYRFEEQGERHLWMYDRYSLTTLLQHAGFRQISLLDAITSNVANFGQYMLDGAEGTVRKPDSLFMEGIK